MRFRKSLDVLLMALLLILGSTICLAQNGHDLFQQALVKERTEGDLETAIALHERIAEECADDRPLAAKALLHLGQCYEKLGKDEARKTYERLLQEYADQTEVAAEARTRLAALIVTSSTALTVRRLENPPPDAPTGEVSPDGRYLTFLDWQTGDLAVRDLRTGQDRRVTDEGSFADNEGSGYLEQGTSTWSRDSKEIAYIWHAGSEAQLRIVDLEGGEPRTLVQGEDLAWNACADWSPDGKAVLAVRGSEAVLVSVADGSMRTLRTGMGDEMRFSPDGRYIAYNAQPNDTNPERDIFLLSVETRQASPIVQHPADDFLLGWSADGNCLVFASDRTGALGLWIVDVDSGEGARAPQLVKRSIGRILPMGLTDNGALFYGVVRATEDVYVVELDPQTGRVMSAPKKLIEQHEGGNYSPVYSRGGEYLAYVSKRGSNPYPTNLGNTLCVRSLKTGEEREFYREVWRLGLGAIAVVGWSSDDRCITFVGWNGGGCDGAYRIDLMTSEIRKLFSFGPDGRPLGGTLSPDGKVCFEALGNAEANTSRVVIRDLETGSITRELYRFPTLERRVQLRLSPDGKWLSFLNAGWGSVRALRVMPVEGGIVRDVVDFGEVERGTPTQEHIWSADGKRFLYNQRTGNAFGEGALWRVSVEGGEPKSLGLEMQGGPISLTLHPSGRFLAFTVRRTGSTASNVWIVENFLPPVAQAP